jgi:UDP-N-acetylglucosamine--N-acetylmuramyl-(pentapeptide) pyrophosphoryl-undecaprenol N-acetylglucosamine transferase
MKRSPLKIVIAGGGTGGHLFPAIAIAQEFTKRDPQNDVLFVCTGRPFDKTVLSRAGFRHTWIAAEGIKGRGLTRQAMAVAKIPGSVIKSIRILKGADPDLVVGVGSYVAGPVAVAARLLGVKIVLHEQNLLPGITNRMLAPFAERIFVSFEKTGECFSPEKIRVSGNPVRREILNGISQPSVEHLKERETRPFTVFVSGGSQGAHRLNLAMMEAVEHLGRSAGRIEGKMERFFIVHQTGSDDCDRVKGVYRNCGIAHEVRPFFHDMQSRYQKADLMICRAGATTVAEITALGKGVIFVPFPFAADNHQVVNAKSLSGQGAAEMILEKDIGGGILAERIEYYASRPEDLRRMAARAKAIGRPDAAKVIVDDIYNMFKENT